MKHTALYDEHKKLGAKMVPYAGFEMPVQYSGVKEEHQAVRENVGLFDVSHMGQFLIQGTNALDLIQHLTTNDVSKIAIGQAQYNILTDKNGGIIDDLIVYRYGEEVFMMVVNAANIEKDWNWIEKINKERADWAEISNESDSLSLIAVQGPKAVELVQRLSDTDVSKIKFYHFQFGSINGLENVNISATGYTGSGGFELYMPNHYAPDIWNALLENGEDLGVKPAGLAARDTLRLEKAYSLYGNDIDETTTPLEANLAWVTKFGTDFIGENALKIQKEQGITKKLVGFSMIDKGIPRKGYPIVNAEGKTIGRVTSGTQSPTLNQGIGLGYVTPELSKVGSSIYIEIRNKKLKAEVVKTPFV